VAASQDEKGELVELQRLAALIERHSAEQRIRDAFPGCDPSGWVSEHAGGVTPTTIGVPWVREDAGE
jgi:hypothetical protein